MAILNEVKTAAYIKYKTNEEKIFRLKVEMGKKNSKT